MNNFKKLMTSAISLSLVLGLTACGTPTDSSGAGSSTPTGEDGIKIAIVKQLDHASMDEIGDAVEAQLDLKSDELGIEITYKSFSGQDDSTVLGQIGAQIIADEYDAIIPIGTLAAQQMVVAAEATSTPVVFAAVSDPVTSGLTDIENVTGVSDALNTAFILDMMFAQNPDIKTVGLLYSTSQDNSIVPIADAKAYLDAKGISYLEKTGNTNDEIIAAVNSMLGQVDAVFTPTDNKVMAVAYTIGELMAESGIPYYTGADSFVRNGAFAASGVNYGDLGAKAADITLDVLTTGEVPTFHVMEGGIITVNTETATILGADYSVFAEMAGQVIEVITTEE